MATFAQPDIVYFLYYASAVGFNGANLDSKKVAVQHREEFRVFGRRHLLVLGVFELRLSSLVVHA